MPRCANSCWNCARQSVVAGRLEHDREREPHRRPAWSRSAPISVALVLLGNILAGQMVFAFPVWVRMLPMQYAPWRPELRMQRSRGAKVMTLGYAA
jgi:hypothetical protein